MIIKQYETFTLNKDLNPIITEGMVGVILEVLSDDTFEVEFVKEDGTNYEYKGAHTFTITAADAVR